jgi:CRP/FNR family cyclic AMP-dependent transcriptional regulator
MVPDPTRYTAPTSPPWPPGSLQLLLGEQEWQRLVQPPATLCELRPGEKLIEQGATTDDVFLILNGFALVTHDEPGRGTVALAIRGRGDVVGEMAGWTKQPRSASVRACGPISVWSMPYRQFAGPQASYRLARAMVTIVARKLSSTDRWLLDSRLRPALARTARVLLELATRYGGDQQDGRPIGVPLAQADLATIAGLSLSSIERSLKELRDAAILGAGDRNPYLTVLDINKLGELARRPQPKEAQ